MVKIMLENHEIEYTKTVEDYLYGAGMFAGVYGVGNTLQHLANRKVSNRLLVAGGHQLVPTMGSNFMLGVFGGNALYDIAWNKTIGKTAFGKAAAMEGGFNKGWFNFSYTSNSTYQAAGGLKNAEGFLPGLNVTTAKAAENTRIANLGIRDMYANTKYKPQNVNTVKEATKKITQELSPDHPMFEHLEKFNKPDKKTKAGRRANRSLSRKEKAALKKQTKLLSEEIPVEQLDDFASKEAEVVKKEAIRKAKRADYVNKKAEINEKLLSRNKGRAEYDEIVETIAKSKKDVKGYRIEHNANRIVDSLQKDDLLKIANLGDDVADDVLRATAAEKIQKQLAHEAFKKTIGGKALGQVAKGAVATGKFFFSAPVQTILFAEAMWNLAASQKQNQKLEMIKSYERNKTAYFESPVAGASLQTGYQISQNNNSELDYLLSSTNIAGKLTKR